MAGKSRLLRFYTLVTLAPELQLGNPLPVLKLPTFSKALLADASRRLRAHRWAVNSEVPEHENSPSLQPQDADPVIVFPSGAMITVPSP